MVSQYWIGIYQIFHDIELYSNQLNPIHNNNELDLIGKLCKQIFIPALMIKDDTEAMKIRDE